ncbi:hypothetical protein B0T16DRAFT_20168 [Cercophora newfieldiana]|uniref:Uncharacterized protein n=1 Tax=Cercophora newfieldiana TaxID=92897 RepID=A0AA40CY91_9PEZI|nr:hypothetical protein B0T16DRAFT_20168 [Cercophora newfieldiana]
MQVCVGQGGKTTDGLEISATSRPRRNFLFAQTRSHKGRCGGEFKTRWGTRTRELRPFGGFVRALVGIYRRRMGVLGAAGREAGERHWGMAWVWFGLVVKIRNRPRQARSRQGLLLCNPASQQDRSGEVAARLCGRKDDGKKEKDKHRRTSICPRQILGRAGKVVCRRGLAGWKGLCPYVASLAWSRDGCRRSGRAASPKRKKAVLYSPTCSEIAADGGALTSSVVSEGLAASNPYRVAAESVMITW